MNFNEIIEEKIVTLDQLQHAVARWRMFAKKIVFTNGCFDLLHPGHLQLLQTARSFGNVLIVGLNTDASVKRIKPGRPVQDERSRALIMAAIEVVDAVILFDEDTPKQLIAQILPDVLVKGGDYRAEEVAGKDIVEQHGGRVELVPLAEGFSTSSLIKKICG